MNSKRRFKKFRENVHCFRDKSISFFHAYKSTVNFTPQVADCSGRGFSAPPTSTSPYGLTGLRLEDNNLGQLEVAPLAASWPRLKSLDLSRNRIREVQLSPKST
jgi:hypothetical protein